METPVIYDSEKRYIFSNWTKEDFIGIWAGAETLIKKGESIELPQFKAFHFCKHLVDREMAKTNVVATDSKEARQPYEEKTIAEITAGVDSPALANLKEKIKKEIKEEGSSKEKEVEKVEEVKAKEFEDIEEPVVKKKKK